MNFNINDLEIEKAIENYKKDLEERTWKNEDRFNNFIEFLYKKIDINNVVCSDSFYYNEDDCSPYNYRDFEKYLFSLYDAVEKYANENYIQIIEDPYEYSNYFVLKYKDRYYSIECIYGQGSFVRFECLKDFSTNIDCVDYELMINNKKSPNYNKNIEQAIFDDLDGIFDEYEDNKVSKTLIVDIFKKYIESK